MVSFGDNQMSNHNDNNIDSNSNSSSNNTATTYLVPKAGGCEVLVLESS